MTNKGKLIVIEGGDGSGKTTQADLLKEYLDKKNIPTMLIDFPQYDTFYGEIIAKYLRGEFGAPEQTSPFLVAILFALDRTTLRDQIVSFLKQGGYVIANRYVPSNVAHQAANINDPQKQDEFVHWIQELEYNQMKLPQEDTVIYLYLPWDMGMKKSKEKISHGTQSDYHKGQLDIHEKSEMHRKEVEKMYLKLSKQYNHWRRIDCIGEDTNQLTAEQIHLMVISTLNI
jgi:dTMP kinase